MPLKADKLPELQDAIIDVMEYSVYRTKDLYDGDPEFSLVFWLDPTKAAIIHTPGMTDTLRERLDGLDNSKRESVSYHERKEIKPQ